LISVVILGLGRVGSRNAGKPGLETLSHVGAILADGGFEIRGLVDPDDEARRAAATQWSGRPVGRIAADVASLGVTSADVAVVAGSTVARETQIDAALSLRPKIVVVEKPLASSASEGRRIAARIEASGAQLRVNFNRRFDPGHVDLKNGLAGVPRKAVMRYGKGLRNYASHMVDLLLDWFGPIEQVQAFGAPAADDGPLDFRCRMKAGFDAVIVGIDGLDYDQFEIDFLYADRRIELADGGVLKRRYDPVDGRVYPGYVHLTDAPKTLHRGAVGGFVETYAAIRRHLTEGAPLGGCGTAEAVAGLAAIDAALRSAALGGVVVAPLDPF
jgi:predicted dehydrogenase